jgi:RNA polymerase sigma-70 factor (ECF subfamily)
VNLAASAVPEQRMTTGVDIPPAESDLDLVRRSASGDQDAFKALFDAHSALVFNVAYRMLRNRTEAEDLLQEVWLVVFREIGGFRGESRFTTWLTSITANRCINRSIQKRRQAQHYERFSERAQAPGAPADPDERVQRALASLPEEARLLATLRYVAGSSYEEIAETLGCPLGTVKSKMYRVHEALRKALT